MRGRGLGRGGTFAAALVVIAAVGIAWRAESSGTAGTSAGASGPLSTAPRSTSGSAVPQLPADDRPLSWSAAQLVLSTLRVLARRPYEQGYQRDCRAGQGCVFGPAWTDLQSSPDGHNGCRTRDDVLRASLTDVQLRPGSRCIVVAGICATPTRGR
jgi:hypothetical protein